MLLGFLSSLQLKYRPHWPQLLPISDRLLTNAIFLHYDIGNTLVLELGETSVFPNEFQLWLFNQSKMEIIFLSFDILPKKRKVWDKSFSYHSYSSMQFFANFKEAHSIEIKALKLLCKGHHLKCWKQTFRVLVFLPKRTFIRNWSQKKMASTRLSSATQALTVFHIDLQYSWEY